MVSIFLKGFLLSASLIIAIGVQNAFVLRQGLKNRHIFICALTAACIDAFLIICGIAGFGALVESIPGLITFIKWAGAVFLFVYGIRSFMKAMKPESLNEIQAAGMRSGSAKEAILVLLAVSFFNPHVYLDTFVLLGGIGGSYIGAERVAFAAGAILASFMWFFTLGYGARLLSPFFAKPKAWQILDIGIGVVMIAIAVGLVI